MGTSTRGRISLRASGVLFFGDGDAHDVGAGGGELVNLGDAFIDVPGVAGGHGLDGDGGVAADADEAVGFVAEDYFAGFSSRKHQISRKRRSSAHKWGGKTGPLDAIEERRWRQRRDDLAGTVNIWHNGGVWRGGRAAEGDGLLNRYTGSNSYPGFESRPLRYKSIVVRNAFIPWRLR